MLTRRALAVSTALVLGAFVVGRGGLAWADGNGGSGSGSGGTWGNVNCAQHPYPGCQLSTGTSRTTGVSSGTGANRDGGSGSARFSCLDLVPYRPASGLLPPPKGQPARSGGWYVSVCSGFRSGIPGGGMSYPPIWVTGRSNRPAPPSPEEMARRAENQLALPVPKIMLSPAGQQLVNLPTWLAIDRSSYTARSATAAVPGVSVTATARPMSVVWSTGDGAAVSCRGPGSAFRAGDDPASASPTCGHTYRVSSASQPGAVFTVRATVHWSVSWSGAGQGGTFPGLTTTASARVPVAESQALTSGD